jgi:hypothetical protein
MKGAEMADPKGESLKVGFDGSLRLEFHGRPEELISKVNMGNVGLCIIRAEESK